MEGAGEFELIERLTARLGNRTSARVVVGPGDDAAVTTHRGESVVSVDAIVEGVHFTREAGMQAIGHKALAQALSDVAAMGAEAGEAYIALGLPPDIHPADCLELYSGLGRLAEATGTLVAGGDVVRSPVLWLSVTVAGAVEGAAVLRSGAHAGDAVVVTGALGGAAAALALRRAEREAPDTLANRLDLPEPRLAEGRALREAGASAMIDVSDGLGADAGHLASASGARLRIELARIPLDEGVADAARQLGTDPIELAARGGEDYELLACVPAALVEEAGRAVAEAGGRLTPIGAVEEGEGVRFVRGDGSEEPPPSGWDHLADARA